MPADCPGSTCQRKYLGWIYTSLPIRISGIRFEIKEFSTLHLSWLQLRLLLIAFFASVGCVGPKVPSGVREEKNIKYARVGSDTLRLDIYSPKHISGKLPVVVWIHPGGWAYGNRHSCPIACLATQEFSIVSIDYRLSCKAPFPAQIYDCKGAVRWLRANADKYNLDAERIGIYGASSGGHLAALLGTTDGKQELEGDVGGNLNFSSQVQAVCALYPPTDLNLLATNPSTCFVSKYLVSKLLGKNLKSQAPLASPINYVSKNSAPFFLLHGNADTLVPIQQSQLFYEGLKKAGVEVYFVIVPGKGHGFIAPPSAARQIYAFFKDHLYRPFPTEHIRVVSDEYRAKHIPYNLCKRSPPSWLLLPLSTP